MGPPGLAGGGPPLRMGTQECRWQVSVTSAPRDPLRFTSGGLLPRPGVRCGLRMGGPLLCPRTQGGHGKGSATMHGGPLGLAWWGGGSTTTPGARWGSTAVPGGPPWVASGGPPPCLGPHQGSLAGVLHGAWGPSGRCWQGSTAAPWGPVMGGGLESAVANRGLPGDTSRGTPRCLVSHWGLLPGVRCRAHGPAGGRCQGSAATPRSLVGLAGRVPSVRLVDCLGLQGGLLPCLGAHHKSPADVHRCAWGSTACCWGGLSRGLPGVVSWDLCCDILCQLLA